MTRWPETVGYILRTYATYSVIQEAIKFMKGLLPASDENVDAFAARIGSMAYSFENEYSEN